MNIQQYQLRSRGQGQQLYDDGPLPMPPTVPFRQRPTPTAPAVAPAMPQQPGRAGYQLPTMPGQYLPQGRAGGSMPQFQPWSGGYQFPWQQQQQQRRRRYANGVAGQPYQLQTGMGGGYGGGYQMPVMDQLSY